MKSWGALLLFALGCLAASFVVSEGRYVALPLVGLVAVALRIAARSRRRRSSARAVEPERLGPSRGPQVVGRKCAGCGAKFVVVEDAAACGDCDALVHPRCRAAHAEAAHGAEQPYR